MADPVGEDGWMSLVDEASRSAGDLEQRVGVVELYKRALRAEPWSTKLWLAYCEWFWSLYTDCQTSDAGWPEEEQMVGQDIFSLELALEAWQEAAQATQYRLSDSHEVWNRWISIELEELSKAPTRPRIDRLRKIFEDRLQIPHAAWNETSQTFSTFISKYDEAAWEATMVKITQLAKKAKEIYGQCEAYELKIQKAVEFGDIETTKLATKEYLDWEVQQVFKAIHKKPGKKGPPSTPPILCIALYERALSSLSLGSDPTTWEDYISFLSVVKADIAGPNFPTIRAVLDRATSHCPWHGPLWARYILSAELDGLSFSDIEHIKHTATSTGVLERDGIDAVLDVYAAWCGYLRRRTVAQGASDEDMDVAEVGLQAALESVQESGVRLYGKKDYKGDPNFRIERILINFLTAKGAIEDARNVWRKLTVVRGDSYDFWQQYYFWEMTVRTSPRTSSSSLATGVLMQAANRKTLDWPERMLEVYIRHCSNYEDAPTFSSALDVCHRMSKGVAKRRQREAAEAAATYAQQQPQIVVENSAAVDESLGSSKRKRESASDEIEGTSSKKMKSEEDEKAFQEQHLKRDRENTTVLVTNLPEKVAATKVRQYFKEYGHINSLTIEPEGDGDNVSSTALIEFKSTEDVQSALLRDGKYFGENQIHVEPGTGLTLYVTNYPPTADEAYFRDLFKSCGDIFSIRWPSLKYNNQRRFCYISFRTKEGAAAATQFDGQMLQSRYKLVAKYSNPAAKKAREGATAEGREVHVASLDLSATEEDVKDIFQKYGKVQGVRILRNMAGRSKGAAFIDFEKPEEAQAACELNGTKFKSQIMKVEVSKSVNFKPTTTTGKASSASPAPDADGDSVMSPAPTSDEHQPSTHGFETPSSSEISARTIALMNVPDTINDARIRALVEPYGTITKLSLRLDHQGAIIEFSDVAEAGKAALGLEGHEIAPGRKLKTGGLKDLFHERDEKRTDKIQIGQNKKPAPMFVQPSAPVRRPGAGGRGGLGQKRGLGYAAPRNPATAEGSIPTNGTNENGKPKSNEDFKKMFLSGGKE
ncbi:hypothetical protein BP6252_12356 [Coleophoma cylindrospora]|uniref:U4/U6 snRNA-associated-splicing factor PRP24 n=1 Tax=Coleophoma cylindrospora TaxID=1849047 RepID=A0A3D8QGL8_9HELO|nr:hypothetical protein BP6252_12356 [Coleophoma cylindrospora]